MQASHRLSSLSSTSNCSNLLGQTLATSNSLGCKLMWTRQVAIGFSSWPCCSQYCRASLPRNALVHDQSSTITLKKESTETVQHNADTRLIRIEQVRNMLVSLDDGEISPSAYDTAWVARIPSQANPVRPEFPETLGWIVSNQHSDGSWGDGHFQLYDRILNTISCLVALKTWNLGAENITKGENFLQKHVHNLKKDDGDLLCGFEFTLLTMFVEAQKMGLKVSNDIPTLKLLEESQQKKIKRIPLETIHSVPTTILYSLEGLQDIIKWDSILKLIGEDGSFMGSPSSTACVYMHTKEIKCLDYLRRALKKLKASVPNNFTIDIFERLWIIDILERLGIDRHFQNEINQILSYVKRHWCDNEGVGWGKQSILKDIDDTSMAFRLLRLHGYKVSPNAFLHFMAKDGKFFCFPGELNHGASEMLNLYRASQIALPAEDILSKAKTYSSSFLSRLDDNYLDKWSFKKNFTREVNFELLNPWKSCLPRMYSKSYIQNYSPDDIWIAKTIYRLPCINNTLLLELAKEDFNICQSIQKAEIQDLFGWWSKLKFGELPFYGEKVVTAHFSIGCCMFEPEFSELRVFYTKYALLSSTLDDLADYYGSPAQTTWILQAIKSWDPSLVKQLPEEVQVCFNGLYETINEMVKSALEAQAGSSIDIKNHMQEQLSNLVIAQLIDAEWMEKRYIPSFKNYLENGTTRMDLILNAVFFCGERISSELMEEIKSSKCLMLTCLIARICNDLATYKVEQERGEVASSITCYMRDNPGITEGQAVEHLQAMIETSWKQLTEEYLTPSRIPQPIKRLMFETARIFQFIYPNKDNFKDPSKGMRDIIDDVLYSPA